MSFNLWCTCFLFSGFCRKKSSPFFLNRRTGQVRSLCLSRVLTMKIPNAQSHLKPFLHLLAHGEQLRHWAVQHVFVPLMGMGIWWPCWKQVSGTHFLWRHGFYQWILRRELLVQLDLDFSNLWGFTLLNFLMNVGQFTLPVLFARHGWFAIILIALGSILCAHTALLMTESLVQLLGFVGSGEVDDVPTPFKSYVSCQNLPPTCSMLHLFRWDGRMGWFIRSETLHGRIIREKFEKFRFVGFHVSNGFLLGGWTPHHPSQGYLTISSIFSTCIFGRLMRRGVPTPDYSELAVAAVGQQFALLSQASGMIELLTYNCMNLIGLGKGVVSVFPALSMEVAMSLCIAICVGLSAVSDRHFSYIALIFAFAILAAEGTCFLGGLELSDWESWHIQDVSLKEVNFGVVWTSKQMIHRESMGDSLSKKHGCFSHFATRLSRLLGRTPALLRQFCTDPKLLCPYHFCGWNTSITSMLDAQHSNTTRFPVLCGHRLGSLHCHLCFSWRWFLLHVRSLVLAVAHDLPRLILSCLIMMPFLHVFVKSVVVESPQPVQAVIRICNSTDDHGEHRSRFVAQNCSWGTRTTANVWDAPSWIQYLFVSGWFAIVRWLNLGKKRSSKKSGHFLDT